MRRVAPLIILAGLLLLVGGIRLLAGDIETLGDPAVIEGKLQPGTTPTVPTAESWTPPTTTTSTSTTVPVAEQLAPTKPPIADPVRLRIGALDIVAPIGAYGVNERTGQMAVPNNITEVGWYRFGPRPGEPGSAVLAAHVDLAGIGPGVFFELGSIRVDDRVSVVFEDGSEAEFRVVATTVYRKDELPLDVVFSRQGPPVLTLITCGGDFNPSLRRYDSNLVVYAVPV